MTGTLQAEETAIDREVVSELVELTPEWWHSAVLEVSYAVVGGVERYSHVISSPEGHRQAIVPSEKLFDATHRLGVLFEKYGRRWQKVTYRVEVEDDGSSKYIVDFEY